MPNPFLITSRANFIDYNSQVIIYKLMKNVQIIDWARPLVKTLTQAVIFSRSCNSYSILFSDLSKSDNKFPEDKKNEKKKIQIKEKTSKIRRTAVTNV